jgi:precorrin-2/cobalt-factor-2 C20-methyltransferase
VTIGILYGISVGTGDSELITVKGVKLLQSSQIVAFPAGKGEELGVAQQIIQPWLNSTQKQLALDFPYVQDEVILKQAWYKAAQLVWYYLQDGKNVAFACEGDVNFYGTFSYLAQTLSHLYPSVIIEVVPGVISPLAAVASLGLPLTQRQQRLLVLPVLYQVAQLESAIKEAEIIVLMKVSSVYAQVWQILQSHNLLKSSYVVEKATMPGQKIYKNLEEQPNLELSYFSLLIVYVNRL